MILLEASRTICLTFVGVALALTLIGSGAGIARRGDRPRLTRIVAAVAWLVGISLLYRIVHLWGIV